MKKIQVKDFCQHCMTREKGKKLYQYIISLKDKMIEFDFSDIEYVSSSFLDETVWKLVEENFIIKIADPDMVIEKKLHKLNKWTRSNFQINKHDRYLELAG
ncbi:MAG: hypothetical protein A2Y94_07480 [Caldithrix sp. RBG_13_44_9]|nr:MAG: hypothetical protein A2Y94_07480 [Caldithrix sp. RBG_13_44_9]